MADHKGNNFLLWPWHNRQSEQLPLPFFFFLVVPIGICRGLAHLDQPHRFTVSDGRTPSLHHQTHVYSCVQKNSSRSKKKKRESSSNSFRGSSKTLFIRTTYLQKMIVTICQRTDWSKEKLSNFFWTDGSKIVLFGSRGFSSLLNDHETLNSSQSTLKTVKQVEQASWYGDVSHTMVWCWFITYQES